VTRRIHFTPDASLKAAEAGHRLTDATISGSVIEADGEKLFSLGADADIWTHILLLLKEDELRSSETFLFSAALYESILNIVEVLLGYRE